MYFGQKYRSPFLKLLRLINVSIIYSLFIKSSKFTKSK